MAPFGRVFAGQLTLTLAAQATVGLVGVVRIPLAVDLIGVGGYALLASYSAAAAWLIAPASANQQYVLAFGGWTPLGLLQRMRGGAGLLAVGAMAVGVVGFILGNGGNEFVATQGVGQVAITFGALSLALALLSPGGARLGRFGAWYGVWLFPVLEVVGNIVSLVAVFALARSGTASIAAIAVAWVVPIALPYGVGFVLSSNLVQRWFGARSTPDAPAGDNDNPSLQPYLWIVMSPLVASGLDLFIVGALLTTQDVAALALVSRLSVPLLIVPSVVRVLVVREVGRRHNTGERPSGLGRMRRTIGAAAVIQTMLAAGLVWLGPAVFDLLAAGEVAPPYALFPVTAALYLAVLVLFVVIGLGSSPDLVRTTARVTASASFVTAGLTLVLVPVVGLIATRISPLVTVSAQALLIGRLERSRRLGRR